MAALIRSVMSTKDRVPFYVNACHELGIEVLPPDVNESQTDFAVVEGKIRFGLNAVKGVGEGACARDHRRARGRPVRVDLGLHASASTRPSRTSASLEALVKCGALPGSRKGDAAGARAGARVGAEAAGRPARRPGLDLRPRPRRRQAEATIRRRRPTSSRRTSCSRWRRRCSASTSPSIRCSAIRDQLRRKADTTIAELERRRDGEVVTIGGIVTSLRHMTTKRGDAMVFLRVEDVTGGVETVVFNSTYEKSRELCVDRPHPDRQGPHRPQGGRDEARRDGGRRVRGGAREARGAAEDRRDEDRAPGSSRSSRR